MIRYLAEVRKRHYQKAVRILKNNPDFIYPSVNNTEINRTRPVSAG